MLPAAGELGCSGRGATPSPPQGDLAGAVGLDLTFANGTEIKSVTYKVTGKDGTGKDIVPILGSVDVTASSMARVLISGIPSGTDFLVALTAVSSDGKTTCSGSVMAGVASNQTTMASVLMECKGPGSTGTGGILVAGRFDNCPLLKSYAVAPLTQSVGGVIKLTALASDLDGDPLTFTLTQTNPVVMVVSQKGTSPNSLEASLTCTNADSTTIGISVTDGDCPVTATVGITCVSAAAGAGGGPDASAGGASATGGTGTNGSGGVIGGGSGVIMGTGGLSGTGGASSATSTGGTASGGAGTGNSGGAAATGGSGTGGTAGAPGGPASGGAGGGPTCMPSECASAACAKCIDDMKGDPPDPGTLGCAQITNVGDRALCEAAYACFTNPANACTITGDPTNCWCGTNLPTCVTDNAPPTQANGPCLQQVFAAARTTDAGMIRLRFNDLTFPIGIASAVSKFRGGFCSAECAIP